MKPLLVYFNDGKIKFAIKKIKVLVLGLITRIESDFKQSSG